MKVSKILNLKTFLILSLFIWVAASFTFFNKQAAQKDQAMQTAKTVQALSQYMDLYKQDMRFKLAQWVYNYQLVKTQGIDFDQQAFLKSEFQSIYLMKWDGQGFDLQWVKSKEIGAQEIPESLLRQQKVWSFESLVQQKDFMFSGMDSKLGSQIYFGFPVDDPLVGKGVVVAVLDNEFLPLNFIDGNVAILDNQGHYLFHSRPEYIGKIATVNSGHKNLENREIYPIQDGAYDVLVVTEPENYLAELGAPIAILFSGMLLIIGIFLFDLYMNPFGNGEGNITLVSDADDEFASQGYASLLQVSELREKLNKMSLLSSALKGRLDLATLGEIDETLLQDLGNDFQELDQMIDESYRLSQKVNVGEVDGTSQDERKIVLSPSESEMASKETQAPEEFSIEVKEPLGEANEKVNANSSVLLTSDDSVQASGVVKEKNQESYVESEKELSLEELPFAMNSELSFDLFDDELFDEDIDGIDIKDHTKENGVHSREEVSGVVFEPYLTADGSESNDWSKVIEELADELNSIDAEWKGSESSEPHV